MGGSISCDEKRAESTTHVERERGRDDGDGGGRESAAVPSEVNGDHRLSWKKSEESVSVGSWVFGVHAGRREGRDSE